MFTTKWTEILEKVQDYKPDTYARTRNYIDGDVSRFSPYISRGVISTHFVIQNLIQRGYDPRKIEKFVQELAWRDYWQRVWQAKGDEINNDLKNKQVPVDNEMMPKALLDCNTGIEAIDDALQNFYKTGYLHNHVRMYLAFLACNLGHSHWKVPAQWMYYFLLDGDWASNALSWQWVAGANSNKKYIANQQNINKFCHSNQKGSYLDTTYEEIARLVKPKDLSEVVPFELSTNLPETPKPEIIASRDTLVYNYYNIDPMWHREGEYNRILLLEPNHFEEYPISEKSMDFLLDLSRNIEGIQIFTGSFSELQNLIGESQIIYKEHPLNNHYVGKKESRDWIFPQVEGYFPSFFSYWKKCKKYLKPDNLSQYALV